MHARVVGAIYACSVYAEVAFHFMWKPMVDDSVPASATMSGGTGETRTDQCTARRRSARAATTRRRMSWRWLASATSAGSSSVAPAPSRASARSRLT